MAGRPRTALLALAASVAATVLVACGGTGDGARPDALRVGVGEPDFLTPARQTLAYDQVRVLFAPLTSVDGDGRLAYVQAASVTPSADRRTWTIRLRSGWTFHDGEPVTARSYVDAWNYAAYGPNAWAGNGQMAAIEGYEALNPAEGEPRTKQLSGLRVVDDLTFTVRLTRPNALFPQNLSQGGAAFTPLPSSAYDDLDAYDRRPIGNGPYEMVGAREPNEPMTVRRYTGYRGTPGVAPEIVFQGYTDLATGYTDALADSVDVTAVPADKFASARTDLGDRLRSLPAPGIDFLGFSPDDVRFEDVRVRRALSLSLDRKAIARAVYGGLYEPATALTPPAEPGSPTGTCTACRYDAAQARELLAAAGGWDGPLTITYPGGLGLDQLYTAYANSIRQTLDIDDVTARPTTDFAEYAGLLEGGKLDGLHFGHWGALVPTMQDTMRNLFTEQGGCAVCTGYSEPEVTALLDRADAAPDATAGQELYVAAQRRALEDMPVIPTFSNDYVYATSTRVRELPETAGSIEWARVRIAP